MPPSRKTKRTQEDYEWVAGGMRGITHSEFIARGGFGEVHEVFARKIVRIFGDITPADAEREGEMLSDLCRPGRSKTVVEVLKHGWLPRHPSLYYIDMEYCPETLASHIHGQGQSISVASDSESGSEQDEADPHSKNTDHPPGPENDSPDVSLAEFEVFDWESVVDIIDEVNQGLVYLHQSQIVHRHLKPSNVLFSLRDRRWKLADFGTATKATSKHLHTTRYARGTSCYRSPEILRDHAVFNNKADMFALGCILFELITGQKLFADDWNIREYAQKGKPIFPDLWPSCVPGNRLYFLGQLAQSLLEINPFKRPSALLTAEAIKSIRRGIEPQTQFGIPDECGMSPRSSPPRSIKLARVYDRPMSHYDEVPMKQLQSIGARRGRRRGRRATTRKALEDVELVE